MDPTTDHAGYREHTLETVEEDRLARRRAPRRRRRVWAEVEVPYDIDETDHLATPPPDPYENTALDLVVEQRFMASGPPRRPCRAERQQRELARRARQMILDEEEMEMRVDDERNSRRNLDRAADKAMMKLRAYQLGEEALVNELSKRLADWKNSDPKTYKLYEEHAQNAIIVSIAPCRVFAIVSWFRKGMPESVAHQIDVLWQHYHQEAGAKHDLHRAEVTAGTQPYATLQQYLLNDEIWEIVCAKFGFEITPPSHNGFNDYVERLPFSLQDCGYGYIKHLRASLAVRKIRMRNVDQENEQNPTFETMLDQFKHFLEIARQEQKGLMMKRWQAGYERASYESGQAMVALNNEIAECETWTIKQLGEIAGEKRRKDKLQAKAFREAKSRQRRERIEQGHELEEGEIEEDDGSNGSRSEES